MNFNESFRKDVIQKIDFWKNHGGDGGGDKLDPPPLFQTFLRFKVTKKAGFTFSLKIIFLENRRGDQIDPLSLLSVKAKWYFGDAVIPHSMFDQYLFENIGITLDKYAKHYDKSQLVGELNAEELESCLSQYLYEYNGKNIVKKDTCFKNALNHGCIGRFVTNSPLNSRNVITINCQLQ